MSELTKEWLLKTIAELEEERDAVPGVVNEDAVMALAAMKLALASLEAEAVADVVAWSSQNEERTCDVRLRSHDIKPGPLYTATPATVSVPAALDNDIDSDDHPLLWSYNNGWNACRAAMLQGADGILTNEGTIPVTQFKPVADLYGLTSPTGCETSFTFDAVEARDFIDGGWSCQEYVELERFQEAVSGNSPVIPDGWVMVPEDPTHEMLEAGDEQFGTYDVYRRMIEAAPKLE